MDTPPDCRRGTRRPAARPATGSCRRQGRRLSCQSRVGVIGAESPWTLERQHGHDHRGAAAVTRLKPCTSQTNVLNSHVATCISQARPTTGGQRFLAGACRPIGGKALTQLLMRLAVPKAQQRQVAAFWSPSEDVGSLCRACLKI